VDELVPLLLNADLVAAMVQDLDDAARRALAALIVGKQPLAQFTRQHGALRRMGAARREREQPWRNAPSPVETLWYRALLGTGFADAGHGPEEFASIPTDLLPLIPTDALPPLASSPPGSPSQPPPSFRLPPHPVDDVTTILAYLQVHPTSLREGQLPPAARAALTPFLRQPAALEFFIHFIDTLGLAEGAPLKPVAATARPFLEADRYQPIQTLADTWRHAAAWNDLKHLSGLTFEGTAWHNDPASAREAVLNFLAQVPLNTWWSLDSLVAALKERQPDFQRRGGDYESWYIRDAATGEYLRGFDHWERVDGALVRWLVENPLAWLGLVEVATTENTEKNSVAKIFRVTPSGAAFLGQGKWPTSAPPVSILATSDGVLRVPLTASHYVRFQVARIAQWLPLEEDHYAYRLTPASLERGVQRGIALGRILSFLQEATGNDLPATLAGALRRWERAGAEASLAEVVILTLKSDELLDTLRATPALRPYLGERLGPGLVVVRREHTEALRPALAEVGILLD
jgi:hypothetical protein